MMHRFTPDKYQIADKRAQNKQPPPAPRQEKYTLRVLSTIAAKKTDLFYLTFNEDPGSARLYEALKSVYGEKLLRLTKPWAYEVQLSMLVDWREVQRLTALALEGLI